MTGWEAIIELAPWLAAAGIIAGLLAGLLGIGGGVVIVPALMLVFRAEQIEDGVAFKVAVATSLATIVATSLASVRAHHRRGAVDWATFRQWAPLIVVGSLIGAALVDLLPGDVLTIVFAVLLMLIALRMVLGLDRRPADRAGAEGAPQPERPLPLALRIPWVTTIGALSALIGVGGGVISVPTLLARGFTAQRAVATSSAIGFLIAAAAVVGTVLGGWGEPGRPPASLGYVNGPGLAALIPFTILMAPVGARLAHRLPGAVVKRIFGVFLLFVAGRMLVNQIW